MVRIGYHASHEQFPPEALLEWVQAAERAGFAAAMSSDHFHPWSPSQGHSGFALSWLGAALQATSRLRFGTISVPCGWRYHPAIVAQAGATLARMFPDRLAWMGLGTGQALNEHIVGDRWPSKAERQARLEEGVEIVRALWAGEEVTRSGPIPIEEARLYSRAERPPKLLGAALTPATAKWAAPWADGLITVNQPPAQLRPILDAFREGGGEGKPLLLQVHLSYADSDEEARRLAHEHWRANIIAASASETLRTPEQFEEATKTVRPEDLEGRVLMSADLARHAGWIGEFAEMGFEEIHLHNTGPNQAQFIERFGARVLPQLR